MNTHISCVCSTSALSAPNRAALRQLSGTSYIVYVCAFGASVCFGCTGRALLQYSTIVQLKSLLVDIGANGWRTARSTTWCFTRMDSPAGMGRRAPRKCVMSNDSVFSHLCFSHSTCAAPQVKLRCALSNNLLSASEPSRCEYEFLFETPAACRSAATSQADTLRDEL